MTSTPEKLAFQPPHPLNDQEKAFLQSLTPREKELQDLGTQMLGSSHFIGKTSAFESWAAAQKKTSPGKQSQGAK